MAENQQDRMNRYLQMAGELESSQMASQRTRNVDRREQLYAGDWHWYPSKESGVQRVVDETPEIVADKAVAKLLNERPALILRSDMMPQAILADLYAMYGAQADSMTIEQAKSKRRKLDDVIETAIWSIIERMQLQQGRDLVEAIVRGVVIAGYAGPVRVAYDDLATSEPGSVPLYFQVCDPRCYYEIPGTGATAGPSMVIYKREAQRERLEAEGWPIRGKDLKRVSAEEQVTVYDIWEKEITPRKGDNPPQIRLWHSIIATSGGDADGWLKRPIDMNKARNLWRIPYSFVPARRSNYVHERYQNVAEKGFLDVLSSNWETRNYLATAMAMLVQKAVDPPKVAFTDEEVDVDATTPGAQTNLRPNDRVQVLNDNQANREVTTAWATLERQFQRGTFSAASFGEGADALSGIMTGRLQEAGSETITLEQRAAERCLAEVVGLVSMFAASYGLPGLTGYELFEVKLPGMSAAEKAKLAMAHKVLADPRPDGSKFISDDTARSLSLLLPGDHEEADKIRREQWDTIIKQREVKREQDQLDLTAQSSGPDQNLVRELDAERQRFAGREMGIQPVETQGPPQPPRTPVATAQQSFNGTGPREWNPRQPEPSVGG